MTIVNTVDPRGNAYIDGRDVVQRIEEIATVEYDASGPLWQDVRDELADLRDLVEEAGGYSDWPDATLIRADEFENYAREFAEDIGAVSRDAAWPIYHVDWAAAARDLSQDYSEVDFAGVAYWVR